MSLVDADEAICNLEHVVPQRDDDELSILCLFLHRQEEEENDNMSLEIFISTSDLFSEQLLQERSTTFCSSSL